MPISSFNFGSTHSWSDHARVKNAVDRINSLPSYASGGIRLGGSFTVGYIEQLIGQEEQAIKRAQERIETQRCAGYNAEQLNASREYLSGLESYKSSLETIRDYMKSYNPCGC